ncbi:MAG: hypothetical protein Q7N50_13015, partial [Armatimonadota bacterium]|nr:hypothetical protein [Armatimonadota bacterium]
SVVAGLLVGALSSYIFISCYTAEKAFHHQQKTFEREKKYDEKRISLLYSRKRPTMVISGKDLLVIWMEKSRAFAAVSDGVISNNEQIVQHAIEANIAAFRQDIENEKKILEMSKKRLTRTLWVAFLLGICNLFLIFMPRRRIPKGLREFNDEWDTLVSPSVSSRTSHSI